MTTRRRDLGEDLAHEEPCIDVPPFTSREANELLQQKAISRARGFEINDRDSTRLFEVLGYMPLAVSQAAAFMRPYHTSPQEYLTALEKSEQNLMEHLSTELQDPRRPPGYPNSSSLHGNYHSNRFENKNGELPIYYA